MYVHIVVCSHNEATHQSTHNNNEVFSPLMTSSPSSSSPSHTSEEKREHLIRMVTVDPTNGESWFRLAEALPPCASANVGGEKYDEQACYAQAAQVDPDNAMAWFMLGDALLKFGSVKVGGREYGKEECLVRAVSVDPTLTAAWTSLGDTLGNGDASVQIRGNRFTKVDCYRLALGAPDV